MPSVNSPTLTRGLGPDVPAALLEALRKVEQHAKSVADAVNSSLVLGDTLQVWTPSNTPALKVTVPNEWVTPTLTGGWSLTAGFQVRYAQLFTGDVRLQGNVKSGTLTSAAFTLPSALWPSQDVNLAVESNGAFGKLLIAGSNGTVVPYAGSNVSFSLDCSFRPATPTPYVPSCFPVDLPLSLKAAPQFVFVSAVETSSNFDALSSPSNLAIMGADCVTVAPTSGQRLLRLRNVPGLLPSKTYALTVAAFGGG